MRHFRRWFIAGLLVWIPLGITILVMKVLVDLMDRSLVLIPEQFRPEALLGFNIPGLGVVLTLLVVVVTGIAAANLLGRRLVRAWEWVLNRIPLVRSVYSGAKQVAESLFSEDGRSFKKVVMIEYPRPGIRSIGFLTSESLGEIQSRTRREHVCVFVPTTPNPTSGFIVMVPEEDVTELEMTVDDALKMIISLGVVVPTWRKGEDGATLAPAPPNP